MTKARHTSKRQPDAEALCKQCVKVSDSAESDSQAYLVIESPTGTEHLMYEGEDETLCGRDTSDW